MERFDLNKPRSGNLMLCECGHLKAFHFAHPQWYGGPLSPEGDCVHCKPAPGVRSSCQAFKAGPFQGYKFKMDPHAAMWAK